MFSSSNNLMYSNDQFDDIAPTWPSFDSEDKKFLSFGNKLGIDEGNKAKKTYV